MEFVGLGWVGWMVWHGMAMHDDGCHYMVRTLDEINKQTHAIHSMDICTVHANMRCMLTRLETCVDSIILVLVLAPGVRRAASYRVKSYLASMRNADCRTSSMHPSCQA